MALAPVNIWEQGQGLPENISAGWKSLRWSNDLAYFSMAKKKMFYTNDVSKWTSGVEKT